MKNLKLKNSSLKNSKNSSLKNSAPGVYKLDGIFAPWRSKYFGKKSDTCVFCDIAQNPSKDDENFVLFRAKYCFCVMNRYPYTLGEFMIIPYFHTDNIENLQSEIWLEMCEIAQIGVGILKSELSAKGVNLGMNLGAVAGAGIAEHIHLHLVPRWERDTNFITTIGGARVHGVPFLEQYEKLKSAFKDFA